MIIYNSVKKLRQDVKDLEAEYNRTEDDLKAIQSVGMLIGDVLKIIDDDKYIVKASSGNINGNFNFCKTILYNIYL